MTTTYINTADTAKLIRTELKAKYPAIKFSVRKERFNVIAINFDGTADTQNEIYRLVEKYRGGDFDGMTDSFNPITHEVNGERVSYGADYIQVSRWSR